MLKSLTKAIAYWKAPRRTFVLLHPVKALKWGGLFLVAKVFFNRVRERRTSKA